jgi:HNH endonuclease
MLTLSRLREVLHYDPETGEFRSLKRKGWRRKCGSISRGYLRIKIDGRNYLAQRLAWLWMTGEWPEDEVDHRNRVKLDNRWCNFRPATRLINCNNRSLSKNNTSGTNGVGWANGKWRVRLRGKFHGYFPTKDEAVAVANQRRN